MNKEVEKLMEDTVMPPIMLSETIQYFPNWDLGRSNKFIEELCAYVAKTQAGISFKSGIKEVVDWIEGGSSLHQIVKDGVIIFRVSMQHDDWESKKKEWGL